MDLSQVGCDMQASNERPNASLEIDSTKVDVNVHPTKSDVHFLHEDEMIEAIVGAVQGVLSGANRSRTFSVQVCWIDHLRCAD